MKFFTLDAWLTTKEASAKQDREAQKIEVRANVERRKSYNHYFDSVVDKLPEDLKRLYKRFNLGDSELLTFTNYMDENRILLLLRAENKATGRERGVTCEYKQVRILKITTPDKVALARLDALREYKQVNFMNPSRLHSDPLRSPPGIGGFGELGYSEIELLDDGYVEHRYLFSSGIEITIQFNDFVVTI